MKVFGEAEVSENDVALARDQEISRFDIAMDNPARMEEV